MVWGIAILIVLGVLMLLRMDVMRARLDSIIELVTPEDRLEVLGFTFSGDEAEIIDEDIDEV